MGLGVRRTFPSFLGYGNVLYLLCPPSLAAFKVMVFMIPVQGIFVWLLFVTRKKTTVIMDKRVRLLQEVGQRSALGRGHSLTNRCGVGLIRFWVASGSSR